MDWTIWVEVTKTLVAVFIFMSGVLSVLYAWDVIKGKLRRAK